MLFPALLAQVDSTELVLWHRASDSAPKGCGLLFSFQSLFYLLVSLCTCLVALKLRSLRFHSPRSCRAAVFLIQTNVSLWHGIVFQEPNPTSDCSCKLIQKVLKLLHTMRSFSVAPKNSIVGRIPTRLDATPECKHTRELTHRHCTCARGIYGLARHS